LLGLGAVIILVGSTWDLFLDRRMPAWLWVSFAIACIVTVLDALSAIWRRWHARAVWIDDDPPAPRR
jgi:hypothetical protein